MSFDDVLSEPLVALLDVLIMLGRELSDPLLRLVQQESRLGSWEGIPVLEEVDNLPSIHGDDPVVVEVLVTDFSHLGLLLFKDQRYEGQ